MQQMGEARLQAARAILSYVVPSASDLIDQVEQTLMICHAYAYEHYDLVF